MYLFVTYRVKNPVKLENFKLRNQCVNLDFQLSQLNAKHNSLILQVEKSRLEYDLRLEQKADNKMIFNWDTLQFEESKELK